MSPFLALLVPLLDGNRNPSTVHAIIPMFFFSFLFFILNQSINNDANYTKDELQLAQFLCFIPTFQEMYGVTTITMDRIQYKPTYRCSGHRFSGSGFSGAGFAGDGGGFDSSGFAGSSFLGFLFLVFLVLALLVLAGSFSGFSSSSGSSSRRNRNLPAYRRNPIFLSFLSSLSFFSTQSTTMQITRNIIRTINTTLPFLSGTANRLNLSIIPTYPSRNINYHSNNKNNKQTIYNKRAAESPRSALLHGCYDARKVVVFF